MVKAFILGATGFIGNPVALALIRAGHQVFGLARSEAKAKLLAAQEVTPILGDAFEPKTWIEIVKDIDIVIDAVGGQTDIKTQSQETLRAISEASAQLRPAHAPKLSYIYTSGTWVHGENRSDLKTDTSPITSPAELVAWRPLQEQRVVQDKNLNGIVIRPALLYGKSGSLLHPIFESAAKGEAIWPGTPGGHLALIHSDDLAELFLLAVERASVLGGKIFDAANGINESTDDFLVKLTQVSGAPKTFRYKEAANLYEQAFGSTTLLRPYLARSLLGWEPRKTGLVDGLPTYFASWKASTA